MITKLETESVKLDVKMHINLDPQQRTDTAIKQLLASFADIITANESGIMQDRDPEYLHDFRVAVRRARTLLAQIPDVIPQRILIRVKTGLAYLGTETTPQRDLDVMLTNFNNYRSLLPSRKRKDLSTAYQAIQMQRNDAHRQTHDLLESARYRRLMEHIKTYVNTPQPKTTLLSNAKRPVKEVADARIWKCYKRVLRQGGAITDSSPAGDLHTLRKSCKKLRYLIEFFSSLYPPTKIKTLVTALKQLQDMLGEHHDLHVHHEFISELRVKMHDGNAVTSNTDHALEHIITALELRQYESRSRFHDCLREFTGDGHHKRFRKLFRP